MPRSEALKIPLRSPEPHSVTHRTNELITLEAFVESFDSIKLLCHAVNHIVDSPTFILLSDCSYQSYRSTSATCLCTWRQLYLVTFDCRPTVLFETGHATPRRTCC